MGVIHACHSATAYCFTLGCFSPKCSYSNVLPGKIRLAPTVLNSGYPTSRIRANRSGLPGRTTMAEIRRDAETEPVGIVISRGSRSEAAPKFLAYVWGPAPEAIIEEASKAA
jgi:hypothetical protein